MRTFRLIRDEDPTGISGTGEVAEGVEFYDGVVVMRWRGPIEHPWGTTEATTVVHPDITNVEHLHGHNGVTHIEWDGEDMGKHKDHEPEVEEGVDDDFDPDEEVEPDDSDDPGEGGNVGDEEGEEDSE